jgi:hypothetical protein
LEQRSDTLTNKARRIEVAGTFKSIPAKNVLILFLGTTTTMASRKTAKSREPDVLSAAYLEGTSNKVRFMIYLVVIAFQ